MDDDTTLLLLNEAKTRIDLLTKQTNTQRKVIAELYEERDAAWAALLDFACTITCALPADEHKSILVPHEAVLAAARAGVQYDDK